MALLQLGWLARPPSLSLLPAQQQRELPLALLPCHQPSLAAWCLSRPQWIESIAPARARAAVAAETAAVPHLLTLLAVVLAVAAVSVPAVSLSLLLRLR